MKITYKGDYALKAVLELALHHASGKVTTIHALAKKLDIPIKFLEQVLLDLKRGGFVAARRGKVGGYYLARPPGSIKVGAIIRHIDGPIEPIACTQNEYSGCKDIYKCAFRGIWQDVAKATADIIDDISFENLINRVLSNSTSVSYQI